MYSGINGRLWGGKSRGQSRKELERSVWGDANVLYLDRGLSYIDVYICRKLTSDLCISWYFKFPQKKKNKQILNSS